MINKLIEMARSQMGYKEGKNNDTKYGKDYGLNYNPWCMMFVWWCANKSGIDSDIIPKTASCPRAYKWFKERNQIIKNVNVSKGDIVFFQWNGSRNADHVGIVQKVEGNIFTTIEGNKNDAVETRKVSTSNSCIYAIARPKYVSKTETKTSNQNTGKNVIKELQNALNQDFKCSLDVDGIIGPLTEGQVKKHYLKYYTQGKFVKWTQEQLKRKGYSVGTSGLDGKYGKDTEKAVKKFQKDKKLTQDGCVGLATVKQLIK